MSLAAALSYGARKIAEFWSAFGTVIGGLLLLGYFLTVVAVSVAYPLADWDMVAYVASAMDETGRTAAELHRAAWDAVRERVSEGEFVTLTADRPYRVRQYADPQAFVSMLGFYEHKLLYVKLTEWLSEWMQPVDALRLISTLSALAMGAVVMIWATAGRFLNQAPIILLVVVLSNFAFQARVAMPDLAGAVFLVLGGFFYLRRLDVACAIALLTGLLIRPDNMAFIGVFAVTALFARQGHRIALATLAISLATYFFITHSTDHPGWWTQMYFTNVEYVPTLEGFDPEFSILTFATILVRVLVRSIVEQTWLVLFVIELLALGRLVLGGVQMRERETVLICALVAATVAKFLVAPFHESRYYMAHLMALGMVLIEVWSRQESRQAQLQKELRLHQQA